MSLLFFSFTILYHINFELLIVGDQAIALVRKNLRNGYYQSVLHLYVVICTRENIFWRFDD